MINDPEILIYEVRLKELTMYGMANQYTYIYGGGRENCLTCYKTIEQSIRVFKIGLQKGKLCKDF